MRSIVATEHWSDAYIREFIRTLGDVATSAHLCGKSARAISKRINTHPEFAERVRVARERISVLRRVSTARRERIRMALEQGDDVVLDAIGEGRYHLAMRAENRPEGI